MENQGQSRPGSVIRERRGTIASSTPVADVLRNVPSTLMKETNLKPSGLDWKKEESQSVSEKYEKDRVAAEVEPPEWAPLKLEKVFPENGEMDYLALREHMRREGNSSSLLSAENDHG